MAKKNFMDYLNRYHGHLATWLLPASLWTTLPPCLLRAQGTEVQKVMPRSPAPKADQTMRSMPQPLGPSGQWALKYDILRCTVMAAHSSTLAWKIPWTEDPSRLQSMGSLRVGQDWATSLSIFTFMHWRRKWQPTPVFLPGESQEWRSLVGCRLWGRTESDTTEAT